MDIIKIIIVEENPEIAELLGICVEQIAMDAKLIVEIVVVSKAAEAMKLLDEDSIKMAIISIDTNDGLKLVESALNSAIIPVIATSTRGRSLIGCVRPQHLKILNFPYDIGRFASTIRELGIDRPAQINN